MATTDKLIIFDTTLRDGEQVNHDIFLLCVYVIDTFYTKSPQVSL